MGYRRTDNKFIWFFSKKPSKKTPSICLLKKCCTYYLILRTAYRIFHVQICLSTTNFYNEGKKIAFLRTVVKVSSSYYIGRIWWHIFLQHKHTKIDVMLLIRKIQSKVSLHQTNQINTVFLCFTFMLHFKFS